MRLIFLLIGMALLYGAFTFFSTEDAPQPEAVPTLSVTVSTPQQGTLSETVSATGVTIAREEIQVMTELSGIRVTDVLADVGDKVKKGQKLAVLDDESLANQYAELKSIYERTYDAFARADKLKSAGAVSLQEVTVRRTDMQAARAKLDDAKLNLKRTAILAPQDGVIFERSAIIGGLVSSSDPLFRIARYNEIEMEAQVPESALAALTVGQPVSITLSGDTAPLEGTIRLITPRVDNATRMATIRVSLQSTHPIPVGLFATARILQSEREGLLLPKTALQHDSSGDFLWVLDHDSIAQRLPVTVTMLGDEHIMVESIAPDARVVARAGAFIKEGDHVRVVESQ